MHDNLEKIVILNNTPPHEHMLIMFHNDKLIFSLSNTVALTLTEGIVK